MPAKSKYLSKSGRTDGETVDQSTIETYMSPQSTSQDGDGETTSSIEWVRAPEDQRVSVGFGQFPFKKGESESEPAVIQDMTFRGRVTYVKFAPNQEFSHTLDLQMDENYIANLKQFVHTNKDVPADDGIFKWNPTPIKKAGETNVRFTNKKDKVDAFSSVWDATSTLDSQDVESREELSYEKVTEGSMVLVEAVPEVYKSPNGVYGCTLHLVSVGVYDSGKARGLVFLSPKRKRK